MLAVELPASVDIITPGNAAVETMVLPNCPHTLCPNFADWLPGDIVVVRSAGHLKDAAIVIAQACSLSPATRAGRHFVYAAIYMGNGKIVDIIASGRAKRSIWTYCEHHAISVSRYTGLDAAKRNSIVQFAPNLSAVGHSYSRSQLVGIKTDPAHRAAN
ncbi:MAG: hypothetical protein ABIQ44_12485 [Chloroflexia bacterium]